MKKKALREKLWRFIDKHPRAARFMDSISAAVDRLMIVYIVIAACFVAIPVFLAYFMLPEEIRTASSTIIGSIMTLIVIPLLLNAINRKKENEIRRFELNKTLYEELSGILTIIVSKEEYCEEERKMLREFIVNNYDHMCINFTPDLISNIYRTYRECTNSHKDSVRVYAERCIKQIRKENGNGKQFMFSSMILELINEENEKDKTAV